MPLKIEYNNMKKELEDKIVDRNIIIGLLSVVIVLILFFFAVLQPIVDTTITYEGIVKSVDDNNATIGVYTFHNIISTSSLKQFIGKKVSFEYYIEDEMIYPSTIKEI